MTLNAIAASNFYKAILQQYDKSFETPAIIDKEESDQEREVDPLAEKTQEYNQAETMMDWYKTVHAFKPYAQKNLSDPQNRQNKILKTTAMQFSAMDRLNAIKDDTWYRTEKESYMLTDLVRSFPEIQQYSGFLPLPVLSFSSPKSELDSLIFERVYCDDKTDRAQILRYMEQACKDLDPHFFNSQQRIYRIQGIVTFIFRNSFVKGLVSTGLIAGTIVVILFVITPRIHAAVTKTLTHQWQGIVEQNPNVSIISGLNTVYHQLRALNNFTTKTTVRSQLTSGVLSLIPSSSRISPHAPVVLRTVSEIVSPIRAFNRWANEFFRAYLLQPSLVAFKILNGTEYRTVQALQEKFKKGSPACAEALQAHALWMHLQKRGTPEATLSLLGYFSTPAA